MDSWDCAIGEDELFCRKVGSEKQLLDQLVERSLNGSPVSIELEEMATIPSADSPSSCSENVQMIPCVGAAAGASPDRRAAPKILKKKTALNAKKETFKNLKKVTFEVEKLVAEEAYSGVDRQDARARLALRLGAAPLPGPLVNYKQLKTDRAEAKVAAANAPPSVVPKFTNSKKKTGKKAGKITKKNRD